MQNLYLVIVGDDWADEFQQTVETPVEVSEDAPDFVEGSRRARFWGAAEGKGGTKRAHFDEMAEGDGIIFHDNNVVFGMGKAGEKYDPETEGPAVGGWLWNNPDSNLVFEVLDYVSDLSISIEQVWRDLGFEESYNQMYSFKKISDDSIDSIQDSYESLSEFYSDLTDGDKTDQPETLDADPVSRKAAYYWVNQSNNPEEIENGFLKAPLDNSPHHDVRKLEKGDLVFNYRDGELIACSEVTTPPYVVTDTDGKKHQRAGIEVTHFEEPLRLSEIFEYLMRDEVKLDKYYPLNPAGINQQYLFNLSEKAGQYILEEAQMPGSNTDRLEKRLSLPEFDIELPDGLYFYGGEETRLRQQIHAALQAGKHIIFTGPPGTGKSRLAKAVAEQAEELDSVDGYTFTTATAEWSSFDTIGGYVPSDGGDELRFDPRLFLRCFRDHNGTVQNRWLVVDELNRANIDKALGPLFSVLSKDSVELPYERKGRIRVDWVEEDTDLSEIAADDDRFPVTPAWRLIGTMNTFDKTSLYDLSFAFMRRFSFIHVGVPDLTDDEEVIEHNLLDPSAGPNYGTVWQRSNPHLEDVIDQHHQEVMVLWAQINEYRSLGPAIILDIFEQLAAFEGGDRRSPLTSAVLNYVFPQLEGLRQSDQESLLKELAEDGEIKADSGSESVELPLDISYLRQKANDMFDLDLDQISTE
ncbi:AAA family ATPase [Halobellus inordinatus]|uniref:AAA family ATPase n=1 Tax=Halobellus inordinatus TaxID=1126236 RepID=UPI002114293E|nr:MoxR family ATPase [Halobellus ramosii]